MGSYLHLNDIIDQMDKTTDTGLAKMKSERQRIFIGLGVLLLVVLIIIVVHGFTPKRSVEAYCTAYKQEKARLAKLPGDTWPSSVFDDSLSDASEFAKAFGRLKQVAPKDIEPDVATLQSLYRKVHDDPSQAMSASLSGITPEENVREWTVKNCTN
jgi:hypothetical protein